MVASGLWASWPLRTHLQGRGLIRQRTLTLIHPSAWKGNSPQLVCRLLHSPARWPPYGRPETSRLLKADFYMLRIRIKMRSSNRRHPVRTLMRGRGIRSYDPSLVPEAW
jgi:hypothetical protein